mmetsp:Transcript_34808/g.55977  ORF Transcript_34808/g.55977 Transcript_34808/m.55977 type:complete len:93 (+) Transcript_34808:136-414(+)
MHEVEGKSQYQHSSHSSAAEVEDDDEFDERVVDEYRRNNRKRQAFDGSSFHTAHAAAQALNEEMQNRMEQLENAFEPENCARRYEVWKTLVG